MKKYRTPGILFWVLSMLLSAAQAQAQNAADAVNPGNAVDADAVAPASGNADYASASHKPLQSGEWFWSISADPMLMSGVSAVAVDPVSPSTLYVGGPGYIAVSKNSGDDWAQRLSFTATQAADDVGNDDTSDDADADDRALRLEALREYLRTELEKQFDQSYVDSLMDDMMDDEILQAREVTDIEVLEALDLEMDPDLTNVELETDAQTDVVLSDFDSFRERYDMMIQAGASEKSATKAAAASPSVWSFVTAGASVFAVTADAVYVTADSGSSWKALVAAPVGADILAMGISADRQRIVLGTTEGLLLSRNGGESWIAFNDDVVRGAAYSAQIAGDAIVVLTTEALYESLDDGLTWQEISGPYAPNTDVVGCVAGDDGRLFVHTSAGLYYRGTDRRWQPISDGPFVDETIRQVAVSDPSFSRIFVRSDAHLFVLDQLTGWMGQNKGLFSNELGQMQPVPGDGLFALIASPSGVWLALKAEEVEMAPEFRALKEQWAKEPSDDYVLEMAFAAHYLSDWVDDGGVRSRLSWLLPTVAFDYYYRQYRKDYDKRVYDMKKGLLTSETLYFQRDTQHYWQIMAYWNINIEKGQKDEISAKTKMASLLNHRERLMKSVMGELQKRRTYQIRLAIEAQKQAAKPRRKTPKSVYKMLLGIQEAEANLHILTGGYYIPAIHQNDI